MTTRSEYWARRNNGNSMLSDGQFNFLRRLVELFLPALGAFYFAMAEIWGWPNPGEVVASIAALTTLLGVVLVVIRNNYQNAEIKYDGDLVVNHTDPEADTFSLALPRPALEEIPKQDHVLLEVVKE